MTSKLLPRAFKIVGIAIIFLTFLIPLTFKLLNEEVFKQFVANKVLFKQIAGSVFLTGFLLFIFAKEKVEDEFADFCRLTAYRYSFIFGLVSVLLYPIFKNNNLDSSYHLLLLECIFYLIIFYATKKGLIRYEK